MFSPPKSEKCERIFINNLGIIGELCNRFKLDVQMDPQSASNSQFHECYLFCNCCWQSFKYRDKFIFNVLQDKLLPKTKSHILFLVSNKLANCKIKSVQKQLVPNLQYRKRIIMNCFSGSLLPAQIKSK